VYIYLIFLLKAQTDKHNGFSMIPSISRHTNSQENVAKFTTRISRYLYKIEDKNNWSKTTSNSSGRLLYISADSRCLTIVAKVWPIAT